jgi:O-Antigen ligase
VLRWIANILIWIALTAEIEGHIFANKWSTWLTPISTLFFKTVLHIVPWDAAVLLVTILTWQRSSKRRVQPVVQSLKYVCMALAGSFVWGTLMGGQPYQAYFQTHCFIMGLVVAVMVMNTCKTVAHVEALGKVVVFACLYRALVCVWFYLEIARHLPKGQEMAALTDHCDSVLFVGGLFVLVVNALERRKLMSLLWVLFGIGLIGFAIVVNNRRIAWLGVGVGFVLIYLLLPKGKLKKRINWVLIALSPAMVAYVSAGWGNPVGIFKPVGSISTMFGQNQDTSSIMRDIENYNLVRTLKWNLITGYGFGRQYIEEIVAFDISSIFPQYRYLPHNSLLGAIAFTGIIGFWGMWQMVAVAVFMHARVYRGSKLPTLRTASMASLVGIVIIEVQMWGDIGFNHQMVTTMLAVAVGLSARLPILADVWPPPGETAAGPPAEPAKST